MKMINIDRRENSLENDTYGSVTVKLNHKELKAIKNALYYESERKQTTKNQLLAEMQLLFDLLEYGSIDKFMIGQIAKNMGVVEEEDLNC